MIPKLPPYTPRTYNAAVAGIDSTRPNTPRTADDLTADLLALAEHWSQMEADRTAATAIRDALRTVLGPGWSCSISQHTGACTTHRPAPTGPIA